MLNTKTSHTLLAGFLVLLLAGLACNLPVANQTPAPTAQVTLAASGTEAQPPATAQPSSTPPAPTQTPQPDVNFEGISFSYDHSLASGVESTIVPATTYEDAPIWDINPEFVQFNFNDYILSDRFHTPAIRVFPIADYQQIAPDVTDVVARLKQFLETCPSNPEEIPFLPFWNAAQMLQSKIQCFEFKNGKGVRFVTQYGQAAYPINNNSLFYGFQGLTSDGQYVVTAVLPVSHPSLPEQGDNPPNGDWDAFYENFAPYIQNLEQSLNQQPDNSFTPSLVLLDEMIGSIQVK